MFDEPEDQSAEVPRDPAARAREKADEFRMHAELAAVFEGPRKFDAEIIPGLNPEIARTIQKPIGRLKKAKPADSPVLPPEVADEAAGLLGLFETRELST